MESNEEKNVTEESTEDVSSPEPVEASAGGSKKKLIIGIIVLVVAAGLIWFMTMRGDSIDLDTAEGQEAAAIATQEEIIDIVKKVSKLMFVPEGDTPTMATVIDSVSLIAEQPFYTGVQDGDKVLLFLDTQRAVIYSPKRNIIVNVGPLMMNDEAAQ